MPWLRAQRAAAKSAPPAGAPPCTPTCWPSCWPTWTLRWACLPACLHLPACPCWATRDLGIQRRRRAHPARLLRSMLQGKGLVSAEELKLWLMAEGLPEQQALQRLLVFSGAGSLPSYIPLQVRAAWSAPSRRLERPQLLFPRAVGAAPRLPPGACLPCPAPDPPTHPPTAGSGHSYGQQAQHGSPVPLAEPGKHQHAGAQDRLRGLPLQRQQPAQRLPLPRRQRLLHARLPRAVHRHRAAADAGHAAGAVRALRARHAVPRGLQAAGERACRPGAGSLQPPLPPRSAAAPSSDSVPSQQLPSPHPPC
jgi:hypothetical protein